MNLIKDKIDYFSIIFPLNVDENDSLSKEERKEIYNVLIESVEIFHNIFLYCNYRR